MSNDYSEFDDSEFEEEEDYGDIIEEVGSEFEQSWFHTKEEVVEAANEYKEALLARGVPEDIAEEQKEAFIGGVWSDEEYDDYYGR